jgi:hypothetical protein
MKPRLAAFVGALVLTVWAATTALAVAPHGSVTVQADGCTFTVLIDLDQPYDVVAWKVKEYNAVNWKDGKTLIKASGATDPDGKIAAGPYTLPEGHYNVAVDNEAVVDGSSIVVGFFLSCPDGTGSELPTDGSAPPPSTAPSTGVEGVAGSPPAGGVLDLTPPPTDVNAASITSGADGARAVVLAIIALIGTVLAVGITQRRASARARIRRR